MDMNIDPIIHGAAEQERVAIRVQSRQCLDDLVKESEVMTGHRGRFFHHPGDNVHAYRVTLEGNDVYGVQRFKRAEPAKADVGRSDVYGGQRFKPMKQFKVEYVRAGDVDAFFGDYALMTWPVGQPCRKAQAR